MRSTLVSPRIEALVSTQPAKVRPRSTFRLPRWVKFVTCIGVGVFLLGSILLPNLCGSRETANRVKCEANLKQIGNALQLFAKEHGGAFPQQLGELIATEDLTPAVFVCPSSAAQASQATTPDAIGADLASPKFASYLYLRENLGKPDRAIVYERLDDHNEDGVNVLFGDFHAEFMQTINPSGREALRTIGIPVPADVEKSK